ncbi:MAG: hypothetical protein HKO14_01175 [Silicimonas sp.]|nr:hypothetical protein [Silicimonas sp.]
MVFRFSLGLIGAVALAGCGAAPSGSGVGVSGKSNLPGAGGAVGAPQGSLGGVELCDADFYRPLIGRPYTDVTVPGGPKLRVYSSTAVVTQEYLPDRTNVVYDDRTGRILRAFCG